MSLVFKAKFYEGQIIVSLRLRPDSSLDFNTQVLKDFKLFPLRSEVAEEHARWPSRYHISESFGSLGIVGRNHTRFRGI